MLIKRPLSLITFVQGWLLAKAIENLRFDTIFVTKILGLKISFVIVYNMKQRSKNIFLNHILF